MNELTSWIRSSGKLRALLLLALPLILMGLFLLPSALGTPEEEPEEIPAEAPAELEDDPEEVAEEEEEEDVPAEGEKRNPLTGQFQPEELVSRRILGVVIDNSPRARPHLGLGEADVIFEILVEGGATRFLALYLGEEPPVVGPVRSSRHYFLALLESLDALMVHCGGSPQAYQMIKDHGLATLDDLRGGGSFFRNPSPGVPYEHTLFTRIPENRAQVATRGLERTELPAAPWGFAGGRDAPGISGQVGQEILAFRVKFPPGYGSYGTAYAYDEDAGRYLRTLGDEPHADRDTGEVLQFENVVILWAETRPIPGDREGRLDVAVARGGEALILTGGLGYSGLWSTEGGFRITGPRGQEVRLTPGKTWIAILPTDTAVEVEGLQP